MNFFKKIRFLTAFFWVRLAGFLLCLLPFSRALRLARPIGHFLFFILPKSRRMAVQNLKSAYGVEVSQKQIEQMARGSFVHLAEFGLEWLMMQKITKEADHFLIEVRNHERIHEELRTRKKGAIVIVSHTGNWEIMALMGGFLVAQPIDGSVYAVARPLKNPYLYEYAMKLRGGMGLQTIGKSGGVQETFQRLRENAIVCVLADQRVSEGSVEVNFFGRPALTTTLPAVAALRLGTPLFFNFLHRTHADRYYMEVEGPVSIEKTGQVKKDVRRLTQKIVSRIEEEIRKHPSRWLWMHNRWRPPHGQKD